MELIVLGAQGWPGPGGAASGYLLRHDGHHLVLDLGNGTLAKLQEHCAMADVEAYCISHAHPDHFADLYSVWVALAYGGQGGTADGVPVHAPPGFLDTMGGVMSAESRVALAHTLHLVPAHDGDRFTVGPFEVEVFRMNHPNDAVGFRVAAGGGVLAYTGDTGPSERVMDLARGADVFLCEATYQGDAPSDYPYHLSGAQAGAYAETASVSRLVLTHQWPSLEASVTQEQAAEKYSGRIDVATSGLQMEVE